MRLIVKGGLALVKRRILFYVGALLVLALVITGIVFAIDSTSG